MLLARRHWLVLAVTVIALTLAPFHARSYEIDDKWNQTSLGSPVTLTYSYSNLLDGSITGLTSTELSAAVVEALQVWSAAAPLQFQQATDAGPLPTSLDSNYSAGQRPRLRYGQHFIDGASGTLAHAFLPVGNLNSNGLAGDVHLDHSETWRLSPGGGGFDIISVLTHETGHAIGLSHEDDVPTIMRTFYSGVYSGPTTAFLYQDDIDGVQANYGAGFGYVLDLGGRLHLSGTSGENIVTVTRTANNLTASSAGFGTFTRSATDVAGLEINTRGGADEIHLAGLTSATTDVRLLNGLVFVESGAVMHAGSSSDVEGYHWSNGMVMMQGGSLVVHGNETGGGTAGVATFQQSGGVHLINGNLLVGAAGVGTLTLSGGGSVSSANVHIGDQIGANGTVSVNGIGSIFATTGDLHVGNAGTGTLGIFNAATVNVGGELFVGPLGKVEGNGGVFGNVHSTGLVAPGPTIDTFTIHGSYVQTAPAAQTTEGDPPSPFGSLLIELASPIGFDKLVVTGATTLGGALHISLLDGFMPAAGNSFDILDWGTRQGMFTTLQLPALAGTLVWSTSQLYSAGVLSVFDINHLPGDFNRDGHVNAADIPVMLSALADVPSYLALYNVSETDLLTIGDLDGSTTLSNADLQAFLILLQSGGGMSAAVPEPATALLAFIGFAALLRFRCRKKPSDHRSDGARNPWD